MSTKLKGDIAEQAAILKLLELGFGVAKPVGDRLPYDLIADINGKLAKLQVKSAWFNTFDQNYVLMSGVPKPTDGKWSEVYIALRTLILQ